MSKHPLSEYVTTREAAALLKRSKSRVDQFVRDGRLAPVETPLGRLFRRADVEAPAKKPRPMGRPKTEP